MSPAGEDGPTGGAGRGAPRLLPVPDLDLSLVTRVRAATSVEAVEDYAAGLDRMPPIRVALVGGRHVVVGGLHRVKAHERAGRTEIPCLVEPVTWGEAVRAAVADNRAHGVRMSRADKRAAIRLLLDEAPDLSSRAIADLVGCSHSTIETIRARAADPSASSPDPGDVQVASLATWSAPEARVTCPEVPPPPEAPPSAPGGRGVARKGRDGKTYRPRARPSRKPEAEADPRPTPATEDAGLPAPQVASPALLMDYRQGVRWAARFLNLALRSPAREHRAEALEELRAALTAEELRRLAAWAGEAADVAETAPSRAGAAFAVPVAAR